MAKRRKSKKNTSITNTIVCCIIAVVLLFLVYIALLQYGLFGKHIFQVLNLIFGTFAYFILGGIAFLAIWLMFFRDSDFFSIKIRIALLLACIGGLTLCALFANYHLTGAAILEDYLANYQAIYNQEIVSGGGFFGAAILSLTTMAFGDIGSLAFAIVLFLIAFILCFDIVSWIKEKSEEHRRNAVSRDAKKKIKEKLPKATKEKGHSIFLEADEEPVSLPASESSSKYDREPEPIVPLAPSVRTESIGDAVVDSTYLYPTIDEVLEKLNNKNYSNLENEKAAKIKGEQLIEVLEQFNIPAELEGKAIIGPSVTKFEIRPEASVKISRITAIQDNIKMVLKAKDIRIEAPVPGRNVVGVEIPNVKTLPVRLYDLIQSEPNFLHDHRKLLFVLGKDLMGKPVVSDLEKMPHLLIAGATGSGKSVCVNAMICTMLLRTHPDDVKMLLIDPKKVEFTQYVDIPHLIGPVISDAKEAERALKVIIQLMENRYEKFSKARVRNIAGYNELAAKDKNIKQMFRIVVIIDELADLFAVARKEIEGSIQRITQLARAAGIHLIAATQRPSTDVITGIIKTNIPSRIAFAVSSGVDSRTILDQIGAERLLGNGDMLYMPFGDPAAMRLQGVYVSDEEINRITAKVKEQRKPNYDDAFFNLEQLDNEEGGSVRPMDMAAEDPMYSEVKEYVIKTRKASTSLLQRRFGLGYNRAARIIDALEEHGVIGPQQGSKPRDVYIKAQEEEEEDT
ncbi:MAG: DNA translocase FtsK [Erysipelotrichaceae bacterium]|jgi:S-DNA-T family DNA segregation ATPase FtsK/SpoIIIE|nr:DNA translocase FtsK [Erysipelotrichaceae bacterium]